MRNLIFILPILLITSCASRKNLSNDIVYDANAEKYLQALQRSKDAFLATDSADIISNDLGWAKRLVNGAKVEVNTIPSVYKNEGDGLFRVSLPCQEYDSDEFWVSTVVVEHKQLDSALIKAKIQGVDDIYIERSDSYEESSWNENLYYMIDSIQYTDNYSEFIRRATLSCVYIIKTHETYIVNATIFIPRFKLYSNYSGKTSNTSLVDIQDLDSMLSDENRKAYETYKEERRRERELLGDSAYEAKYKEMWDRVEESIKQRKIQKLLRQ